MVSKAALRSKSTSRVTRCWFILSRISSLTLSMQSRYCVVACMMTALKDRGCVRSGDYAFAEKQPGQSALKQMIDYWWGVSW